MELALRFLARSGGSREFAGAIGRAGPIVKVLEMIDRGILKWLGLIGCLA